MKISVIIPTYNRQAFLKRSINSVLNQSFKPDEVILVDDCSTDETEKFVKSTFKSVTYVKMKNNSGVSAARNEGIKRARNKWIAFLDSDDEWLEEKLFEQVKEINRSGLKFCHTQEVWIRNGKVLKQKKKHEKLGGDVYEDCIKLCFISPSTSLIHKSIFDDVGLFKENFPVCEDYDLWLRIAAKYPVSYVQSPLINKHGGHDDQLSFKFKAMDHWRLVSLIERYLDQELPYKYKQPTLEMINEKFNILEKGYIKHNRLDELNNLRALYKTTVTR